MNFERLTLGFGQMYCYLLYDEKSKNLAIIDPGYDFEVINKSINKLKLKPKYILLTHSHGDHIGACQELKDKYPDLLLYIHESEVDMLADPEKNLSRMTQMHPISLKADSVFKGGDIIELGDLKIEVIHTPGHSKGSSCFFVEDILFSGDTLFSQSIGRSDLYSGDEGQLISSVMEKIFLLPDEVRVYPGHGSETSIGFEKEWNPFF